MTQTERQLWVDKHVVKGKFLIETTGDKLFDLYERWQDEREYEDFVDYVDAMGKHVALKDGEVTFLRMQKRPFGYVYRYMDTEVLVFLRAMGKGKHTFGIREVIKKK